MISTTISRGAEARHDDGKHLFTETRLFHSDIDKHKPGLF